MFWEKEPISMDLSRSTRVLFTKALWFGVAERWRASAWRDPLAKYMNMIHNEDKE